METGKNFAPKKQEEIERVKNLYSKGVGENTFWSKENWSVFDPVIFYIEQEIAKQLVSALQRKFNSAENLGQQKVLEVGCCWGRNLGKFAELGASPSNLYGIDLMPYYVSMAEKLFPNMNFTAANASEISFPDGFFDVVFQFVTFSAIFDYQLQQKIALEMKRVLKPGGVILWYDGRENTVFYTKSREMCFKGLSLETVKHLFPDSRLEVKPVIVNTKILYFFHKVLCKLSFIFCPKRHFPAWIFANLRFAVFNFLNLFPWLCTHYFITITYDKQD